MSGIERVCISVNSVCNLKCTYCYFFLKPDHLPGLNALTAEEIGVILRQCQAYSVRPEVDKRIKVNFVGSGEPLISWAAIRTAITRLHEDIPDHRLRFYTVTNGLLLKPAVVAEMKALKLSPSVSLDGPAWLHDRTRLRHNGRGSHADVMRGIGYLREGGIPVAINTTLNREVVGNLDAYFDFIEEQGFDKVIFDRLVDVPSEHAVSGAEFYAALRRIAELKEERGLAHLEIGNLEAYKRALAGAPDRVCTMFGSTCGSGFHNIIYMQRDVYPCGRMFGQKRWVLGRYDEPLEVFPQRMAELVGDRGCGTARSTDTEGPAGPDCLIERETPGYDRGPRDQFVQWYGLRSTASGLASRAR
ncbi:radical SAM protein [Nannocystis pusilla]|uniref:radical SAM protein n=1 Tax=Nannocystis pusilla TaxID=889268 RepID=UPI003DA63476